MHVADPAMLPKDMLNASSCDPAALTSDRGTQEDFAVSARKAQVAGTLPPSLWQGVISWKWGNKGSTRGAFKAALLQLETYPAGSKWCLSGKCGTRSQQSAEVGLNCTDFAVSSHQLTSASILLS